MAVVPLHSASGAARALACLCSSCIHFVPHPGRVSLHSSFYVCVCACEQTVPLPGPCAYLRRGLLATLILVPPPGLSSLAPSPSASFPSLSFWKSERPGEEGSVIAGLCVVWREDGGVRWESNAGVQ